MKNKKIEALVNLAANALNIPENIKIEDMDVSRSVYLQQDTLIPVIILEANFLSKLIIGKEIINIHISKSEQSLCFAIIEDKEDSDSDKTDSDVVKLLYIMEAMNQVFGLEYTRIPDLTETVKNWRRTLQRMKELQKIEINKEIEQLVIDNIKINQQKIENSLSGSGI